MSTGPIAVRNPAGRLETSSEAPSERPSRVLVVVAEKEHRSVLCGLLAEEGYEVLPLSDADEVMRVTAEYEPDLVILALGLPGASGLELCGELKASDAQRSFPVLIVAFEECSETAIAAGLLAGADDFAFAHGRPIELKARVRVQLRNKRHLDALTRLRSERDMLRRDAELDGLTGLLNRRALVREVSRQRDGGRRFGALFIDVDHFKLINDLQGHHGRRHRARGARRAAQELSTSGRCGRALRRRRVRGADRRRGTRVVAAGRRTPARLGGIHAARPRRVPGERQHRRSRVRSAGR